jgi:hypothetical protein
MNGGYFCCDKIETSTVVLLSGTLFLTLNKAAEFVIKCNMFNMQKSVILLTKIKLNL